MGGSASSVYNPDDIDEPQQNQENFAVNNASFDNTNTEPVTPVDGDDEDVTSAVEEQDEQTKIDIDLLEDENTVKFNSEEAIMTAKQEKETVLKLASQYQNPAFTRDAEPRLVHADTQERRQSKLRRQSRSIRRDDMSSNIVDHVQNAVEVEIIQPRRNGSSAALDESNGNIPLEFEKFCKWYNVLKNDDINTYKKIMEQLDQEQIDVILDGQFIYSKPPKQIKRKKDDRMAEFCIPLYVAISNCSSKIVQQMLDNDIDTAKYDTGKANILHVLIISAMVRRELEEDYLKIYHLVTKYIPADEVRRLLLEENADGYRPLELSARLGIYGIFKELLNYPGYLVERSFEAGMNTYSVYNLSEYEGLSNRKRFLRNPLRMIAYTCSEGLASLQNYNIIKLPVIEQWYAHLFRRNIATLFIWWFLRCYLISLMVTVNFEVVLHGQCEHIDTTDKLLVSLCAELDGVPKSAEYEAWFAIGWTIIILWMDIAEFIIVMVDKERRIAFKGITNPFHDFGAWTAFYRICQFIQVFLGASAPIIASVYHGGDAFKVLLVMKALSLPFIMMSILYIVEPLPSIGLFAISLQKMIQSIFAFVAFLIPVLLTFSTFFQGIAEKFGFVGTAGSMYRLFMLELGTLDFGEDPGVVLAMVHITYFFMSSILLMNYLIAVMTAAADQTDEDRETLHFLRRLNVALLAHERYGQWPWRLYMHYSGKAEVKVYGEEDD